MLLLTVASFSFSQKEADIKFEKLKQTFKKVEEGHQVTLNYIFTYSGTIPLTFLPPEVDCSCTSVILPKDKIEPNTTDTILVKFDTKDKIGYQDRDIEIQFVSDAMDSRTIKKTITLKGIVKATKESKAKYKETH
ncbi:MAG: DUF1573 domain-containing protein [Vicingaceae bacterium]|nr:DUF1573 domain-containing protein [Vicingaceae bacterium]